MMNSNAKGRELEDAVHAIESLILESSPNLSEESFRIESRKRVAAGGVHHEIDIWVAVEAAQGYPSVFIFECKNWTEAVGKNEIIIFSEKVDAVSAQRGFFVAKSFTRDAEAQAAKNSRVALLLAIENNPAISLVPDRFHFTEPAPLTLPKFTFRVRGTLGAKITPITIEGSTFLLNSRESALRKYLEAWLEETYAAQLLDFRTADLDEGVHPMSASAQRRFAAGDFIIDGQDIEEACLDVEFGVRVIRPAVISDYSVSKRGRAVRLADVQIRDILFTTTFVQTNDF